MPSARTGQVPSLSTFLESLAQKDIESSIELFISLLKRRQIKNPRPCAIATTELLLRVVEAETVEDAQQLIERIRHVGRRLVGAQPREIAVGNIVRRVLGVVREVAEADLDPALGSDPSQGMSAGSLQRPDLSMHLPQKSSTPGDVSPASSMNGSPKRPSLAGPNASFVNQSPSMTSLFSILQHPPGRSSAAASSPGTKSPMVNPTASREPGIPEPDDKLDIKLEVIDGIKSLLDEIDVVDSQIADSALDHVHSNDIVLTYGSSQSVKVFLAAAARKRKFTIVHADAFLDSHVAAQDAVANSSQKDGGKDGWEQLTAMGTTVILIPDSAIFALMSRINKVILAPHTVMANGSLLAAAGTSTIAHAAKEHRVPVLVLSGVYKLSPVYPFDTSELIEYGDPGAVVGFQEGEFNEKVDVVNPVYDWVDSELVDLYITNLGGHAPSFLYRIVADHYRVEDNDLTPSST